MKKCCRFTPVRSFRLVKARPGMTALETVAIVAIGCLVAGGVVKLGKTVTRWCGGTVTDLTSVSANAFDSHGTPNTHVSPTQPTVHTVHPNQPLVDNLQNQIQQINIETAPHKAKTQDKSFNTFDGYIRF